jgi:cytochrome bd-type quinol oxidase subunit 1
MIFSCGWPTGAQSHAWLNQGRAGPQSFAAGGLNPAVLAGTHHAKTGAWLVTEFVAAQLAALRQDGGQQGVTDQRAGGLTVQGKGHSGTARLGNTVQQGL